VIVDTVRWAQVRKVFEEAVLVPSHERRAWLHHTCREAPDILNEVELLLRSHDMLGNFLEPPEPSPQSATISTLAGKRIGPYRIVSLIGEGGMGTVYKAVRDYGHVQKQVAIKVVRGMLVNEGIIERFEQERETLARLQHPNIAQLLDGGTADDNTPYLVMEYIEGIALDAYCDKHKLDVAARLHLFRTICDAVHYAHQNLIVHRDLKPGNILVDATGTPKLLDFGVAKILDTAQHGDSSEMTKAGVRFITLAYASPEQLRNETITTKSDIYSLGVLLFTLLTGQRPYDFGTQLPHEISRAVFEQVPYKPSTIALKASASSIPVGVHPQKLSHQLRGDLDNIILKALEKNHEKRYSSVEHLSEDIRRHLAGLPVSARSATLGYRTAKFIARHKVGVAAVATIVLLVVGGIATALWQANKATKEAAKAEQINAFLQEMLSSADPARSGKDVTVVQTLDRAAERVDKELGTQPEIAASVLHTMGETYLSLGQYDKAERDFRRSLALRERVFGREHEENATLLHSLAFLAQLRTQHAAADSLYQLAITMHKRTTPNPDGHLFSMLSDYCTLLRERHEVAKALATIQEALVLATDATGLSGREYGIALSNYASALKDNGDNVRADSVYRHALHIMKQELGTEHIDIAQAMNNFALVLMQEGKDDEAEDLLRQSLGIRKKVLGDSHPEVALAMTNLAGMALKRNNIAEAEQLSNDALRLYRATINPDNLRISSALLFLGRIANTRGNASQAESLLTEALTMRKSILPPNHYGVVGVEAELGKARLLQKRYAEAERILLHAHNTLSATMGRNHSATIAATRYLVELYTTTGNENKRREYERQLPTPAEARR
jgi:serine/threonine-protein kinase